MIITLFQEGKTFRQTISSNKNPEMKYSFTMLPSTN